MRLEELQNKKLIIGVSGGPDSMALLDMCKNVNLSLIICFVNYHTRAESNLEEKIVKSYALKNNIQFEKCDAYYENKGNFESWARKIRYDFFKNIYQKYNANGLLIAHHLDDLLETYLMQKKRKSIVSYYGISDKTIINNMNVYRPLLNFEKNQLEEYCKTNKIEYSIDSSNADTKYLRNKIRHEFVNKMSLNDKKNLLLEIEDKNKQIELINKNIEIYKNIEFIKIVDLEKLNYEEKLRMLYNFVTTKCPALINKLSFRKLNQIIEISKSQKPNLILDVGSNVFVIKEYDYIYVKEKSLGESHYEIVMDSPSRIDSIYFSCNFPKDTSFLNIYEDDYPLTITNAKKEDIIYIGKEKKKINRLFIEEKIPVSKRSTYPIVKNKFGKNVYFPLYKSEIQKNIAKKLSFVVK